MLERCLLFLSLLLASTANASSLASNGSSDLLWGAYRPNLYFGLRPRLPQSLMTGLIWFGAHDYRSFMSPRHSCEQGDGLSGYTWTEYDPREGGVQVLKDALNNVKITTEFLKVDGNIGGGSWAVRVRGEPLDLTKESRVSSIMYFGLDGLGSLDMETDEDETGIDGPIKFSGNTPDLGEFSIRVVDGPNNEAVTSGLHYKEFEDRIGKSHYYGARTKPGEVWKARDMVMDAILRHAQDVLTPYKDPNIGPPDPAFTLQLPDEIFSGSNLYAVQKTFRGNFQYDILFDGPNVKQKLSSAMLDMGIPALRDKFARKFARVLPLPEGSSKEEIEFSKAITSNLLGGIGYFYGDQIVDQNAIQDWDLEDDEEVSPKSKGAYRTPPRELFSATPSRSFFPRGFYWDEGFHLLHIGTWDNDLSLEILKSWIDLINEDGWVAREQILGDEPRSKVPPEFVTQVPLNANPPTLTMAVYAFIERLRTRRSNVRPEDLAMGIDNAFEPQLTFSDFPEQTGEEFLLSETRARKYLQSIYPSLRRHYEWFRRTQRGQIKQYGRKARSRTEAYRWRGRTTEHILTSGMDDYPRANPHSGELHLDLISWMGFFTRTMRGIANYIGEEEDSRSFEEIENAILANIDDLHWNEERQMYCDVGINENEESEHVCHIGYLSLFPFLLGLLPPTSPHLGPILDILRSPEHLWSPYGLRSLSASHPQFGKGENYWKGPIWIQMNYMALSSLHKTYAKEEGPHRQRAQEIYAELRKNVVDNVFKEYVRTGYVWEQYDPLTGEGRRSHPFTGWSSLVSLILSEKY